MPLPYLEPRAQPNLDMQIHLVCRLTKPVPFGPMVSKSSLRHLSIRPNRQNKSYCSGRLMFIRTRRRLGNWINHSFVGPWFVPIVLVECVLRLATLLNEPTRVLGYLIFCQFNLIFELLSICPTRDLVMSMRTTRVTVGVLTFGIPPRHCWRIERSSSRRALN